MMIMASYFIALYLPFTIMCTNQKYLQNVKQKHLNHAKFEEDMQVYWSIFQNQVKVWSETHYSLFIAKGCIKDASNIWSNWIKYNNPCFNDTKQLAKDYLIKMVHFDIVHQDRKWLQKEPFQCLSFEYLITNIPPEDSCNTIWWVESWAVFDNPEFSQTYSYVITSHNGNVFHHQPHLQHWLFTVFQ